MNYDYLAKIKSKIALYSKKKTSNFLDGEFRSVHRGRSFDFDDLREYHYGDNIKDIDWKSTSKTGKVLIRRYIADKKHNILFVCDSGRKMMADTSKGENKADVALDTLGTIAYLVEAHGADYAVITSNELGYDFSYFKSGKVHFENVMNKYNKCLKDETRIHLSDMLEYVAENIRRKMIVFIITDMDGLDQLDESTLKRLTVRNDVMLINIEDAYMTGDRLFDMDSKKYARSFFLKDDKLHQAEIAERNKVRQRAEDMCKRHQITTMDLACESEIIDKVVELFERHRNELFG